MFPKNRGKKSKMAGENNGKPYEQMDDLGVYTIIFVQTPRWASRGQLGLNFPPHRSSTGADTLGCFLLEELHHSEVSNTNTPQQLLESKKKKTAGRILPVQQSRDLGHYRGLIRSHVILGHTDIPEIPNTKNCSLTFLAPITLVRHSEPHQFQRFPNQATRFVEASGCQNLPYHPEANPCCPPPAATLPPVRLPTLFHATLWSDHEMSLWKLHKNHGNP